MAIPSGLPTAATTGVPTGTTLTTYSGPATISAAGTVIDGKTIAGQIQVTGSNVIIRRCRLTFGGQWGIDAETASGILVEDCDLIGPGSTGDSNSAILGSGTFRRNDISQCENGITLVSGASTVEGNYIHDLNESTADPHFDGISVQGDQNGVMISGNSIIARDTSCVFIKNDFGPINNVKVLGNYLAGNVGFNVYVDGRASGGPITNIEIASNLIEKGFYGYYSIDNASPNIHDNIEGQPGQIWPNPEPPPVADTLTLVSATVISPVTATVAVVSGKVEVTPPVGYSGSLNGTYTARDTANQSRTANWSATVAAAPNPPPILVADVAAVVPFGTAKIIIDVLANDTA